MAGDDDGDASCALRPQVSPFWTPPGRHRRGMQLACCIGLDHGQQCMPLSLVLACFRRQIILTLTLAISCKARDSQGGASYLATASEK